MSDPLFEDVRLAGLYDAAAPERPDLDGCRALAAGAASVLDLGCGTGRLAASLSADRTVVGVDPARAMLDVARRRAGAERVRWVRADARTLRLDERFDLVTLTGHTFQVFLDDEDQDAALATIAAHLAPGGRFVLDTRNPAVGVRENRRRKRYPRPLRTASEGDVEAWNESVYDPLRRVLSYVNGYRFVDTGEELGASARIRYTTRDELAARIEAAGLAVERWLGSWDGEPFDESSSAEIVPVGGLA